MVRQSIISGHGGHVEMLFYFGENYAITCNARGGYMSCYNLLASSPHFTVITGAVNKAFRHVETLFVQGNQVRTNQNKLTFLVIKKGGLF